MLQRGDTLLEETKIPVSISARATPISLNFSSALSLVSLTTTPKIHSNRSDTFGGESKNRCFVGTEMEKTKIPNFSMQIFTTEEEEKQQKTPVLD